MNATPSGRQYEFQRGDQVVVITEVGAGLRTYRVGKRNILDGYGFDERCTGARGHTLIPWPNRIESGKYRWGGHDYQLNLSEPGRGGAIHGLTRWAPWQLLDEGSGHASFGYTLFPRPGWDWVLECRIDYTLNDSGLTVRTSAKNLSREVCPYGTGAHPYLAVGTTPIDRAVVKVPGRTYLPVDNVGIPTGHEPVQGTKYDLRTPTKLGDRTIDVAYTDLERGSDGRSRVTLDDAEGGVVTLWVDEAYPFLQVFTGDTLPQPDRRRSGLGVEPMTCAPDAFNSGEGLVALKPGKSHTAEWGIEAR